MQYYLGKQRLSARIRSRHSVSSGNGKPLYRVELEDVTVVSDGTQLWGRKTVSDGKKWDDVPTGSTVCFDAKLDFDRCNKVQIFQIKDVEVQSEDGWSWWKLW